MAPTVGRIVHYRLSADDAEAINRRRTSRASIAQRARMAARVRGELWPVGAQAHIGNPADMGVTVPLLVVAVHGIEGKRVNGQAFLDGTDILWVRNAPEGPDPGHWAWPPRE